jgi:uncharacterized protein (DUF1330 family)
MPAEPGKHVLLYGLWVRDQALYERYREQMAPILRQYGGGFGYDFSVSKVLRSEVEAPINRVFTMRFPSAAQAAAFFADVDYRAIRGRSFAPAVEHVSELAVFDL